MVVIEVWGEYRAAVEDGEWVESDLPEPFNELLKTYSWPNWSPKGYWPDRDLGYAQAVLDILDGRIVSAPDPDDTDLPPGTVY